jgi:DNA ligase (NAD+)
MSSNITFEKFIKSPYKYLSNIDDKTLEEYLMKLADAYYNDEGLIIDEIYDDLVEEMKKRNPNSKIFNINNIDDEEDYNNNLFDTVQLPYAMMSLDKIKGNNLKNFNNWIKKYPSNYILSDKEDGISCMVYKKNGNVKVFTKSIGGHQGLDITDLAKFININTNDIIDGYCLRGELIISKKNFKTISDNFKNARNAVSGIIHNKILNKKILKLVDFVAYNIVYPRFKQSEQLKLLKEMKMIKVVPYKKINKIDQDFMIEYFRKRKEESDYEIDGIVVTNDDKAYQNPINKNPDFAIAFKNLYEGLIETTEVVDVHWDISRFGCLKPRVEIKPVEIEGSHIQFCTGHNAKYIKDNKINKGSVIKIAKSGGVIPYLVEVLIPSKTAKFPKVDYEWNETGVDIYIKNKDEIAKKQQIIRKLTNTMDVLKVKYFNEGYITRLVYNMNVKNLVDIINIDMEKFIDLIGDNQSIKIYTNLIEALKTVDATHLILASNCFNKGMGIKRINLIIQNIKDLFDREWTKNELINKVIEIKTFDEITAKIFTDGYFKFLKWLYNLNQKQNKVEVVIRKTKTIKQTGKIFNNKKILLTGFRDEKIQSFIFSNGGTIPSTFSNSLSLIIIKDKTTKNKKIEKAKENNIPILTKEEFEKQYKI